MDMLFKFADGSRLRGNAQKVGEKLHEIRRRKGALDAKQVLLDAMPKASVLHKFFTWSNKLAAHKYRMDEARHLIASVITVKSGGVKTQPVRSFVKIHDSYEPLEVVMNDAGMREQALKEIYATIEHLKKKIKAFEGFADIFKSLGQVQAIIDHKMKPEHKSNLPIKLMSRGGLKEARQHGVARHV